MYMCAELENGCVLPLRKLLRGVILSQLSRGNATETALRKKF